MEKTGTLLGRDFFFAWAGPAASAFTPTLAMIGVDTDLSLEFRRAVANRVVERPVLALVRDLEGSNDGPNNDVKHKAANAK